MFNRDSYLKEKYIAFHTAVGESDTLCFLQVDQVCFKKNLSEKLFKLHRI